MSNLKISQLTSGSPAQGGDLLPIDRSGSNFSLTGTNVAALTSITSAVSAGGILPAANAGAGQSVTASQDYYFLPYGIFGLASANNSPAQSSNQVRAVQFTLERIVTFTRMSIYVATTSSTNHEYIGIYTAAGNKIIQGSFTLTASTGVLTATVSQTTLNPGIYYLARGPDNTTSVLIGITTAVAAALTAFNGGSIVRDGVSPNAVSSGVMPSSLGTLTTASTFTPPLVLLEP